MEIKLKIYGTLLTLVNMFLKIIYVYFIFMVVSTIYYFSNGVFDLSFRYNEFLFSLIFVLFVDSFLLNYERIRGITR